MDWFLHRPHGRACAIGGERMSVPVIGLDVAEVQLALPGQSAWHGMKGSWGSLTKTGVYLEPNTGLAMLEPGIMGWRGLAGDWEAGETLFEIAPWEAGSYLGGYGAGSSIPDDDTPGWDTSWSWANQLFWFQYRARSATPLVGIGTKRDPVDGGATSRFSLGEGEGFALRLFCWPGQTMSQTVSYILVKFGGRYGLLLQPPAHDVGHTSGRLIRYSGPTWANGLNDYSGGGVYVASSDRIMPGGASRDLCVDIMVLPFPGSLVIMTPSGSLIYHETDLDPETGQAVLPARVVLDSEGSVIYWAFSQVGFVSGTITSPVYALGDSYTFAPTLEGITPVLSPDVGIAVAGTKGDGTPFADGDIRDYKYELTLTPSPDGKRTPYVWGVQVDFAPTHQIIPGSAYNFASMTRRMTLTERKDNPLRELTINLHNKEANLDTYRDQVNLPVQVWVDGQSVFVGQTEMPSTEMGKAEFVELRVPDRWRRLQRAILHSGTVYDGLKHGDAVKDVLHRAGFSDEYLNIAEDPYVLPSSLDTTGDPLFRPDDGQSAADFLEYIRDAFSGWEMGFSKGGIFYYWPTALTASAGYFFSTTQAANDAGGAAGHCYPYFKLTKSVDDSLFRNEIWVFGIDPVKWEQAAAGQIAEEEAVLGCSWIDYDSFDNPSTPYYVYGERRLLIWLDGSLSTQAAVNWVCRTLGEKFDRFIVKRTWEGPYYPGVSPGALVEVDGIVHRLTGMTTNWESAVPRATYEGEVA